MVDGAVRTNHPLEKHGKIRAKLSGLIRSGAKPPGSRLPTRLELAQQFKTTPVTIQKALIQLATDGFVTARGRAGTFVVDRPPHLYRFGLVIPTPHPTGFLRAIVEQAARLERAHHWRFPIYSQVQGPPDAENHRRMLNDLQAHRLAGLILTQPPSFFLHSPLFAQADLPRVAIVDQHNVPGVGCVRLDNQMFVEKALDHLKQHGRRRVAVVATPVISGAFVETTIAGIAARHMVTRPAWIQSLDHNWPHWAAHIVAAMLAGPTHARPDALIIADDHLVEPVTTVLRQRRVRVPAALMIVAKCNFPNLPTAAVPVGWLGYDVSQVVHAAIQYIQHAKCQPSPAPVTAVPALFAHELTSATGLTGKRAL